MPSIKILSDEHTRALEKALEDGSMDLSKFGICFLQMVPHGWHGGDVFRWKPGYLPGYSHAHSRKIMRERRARMVRHVPYQSMLMAVPEPVAPDLHWEHSRVMANAISSMLF